MKATLTVLVALAGTGLWMAPASAGGLDIAKKAGCMGCHAVDQKRVGPAYRDVAARYQGQAEAVATLTAKVRSGGKGNWGETPKPAIAEAMIGDAELAQVLDWILAGAQ